MMRLWQTPKRPRPIPRFSKKCYPLPFPPFGAKVHDRITRFPTPSVRD